MSKVEQALEAAGETSALRIGSDVVNEVATLFRESFPNKKAIVVADRITFEVAGKRVFDSLREAGIEQKEPFVFADSDLYAEYRYIDQLVASLQEHDAIPVAVGSGTINDLTKLSAHLVGRRYMCVATAASMDGYTAFGASITANGAKQTFSCPAPLAVLADIGIIRNAPLQMTASGYADLFAKVTAGADWVIADWMGVEAIDERVWSIVQDGLHDALLDPIGASRGDEKAICQLIEGLMLGGFAMQRSKSSRPASGAEHQFSHLWNMEHHLNEGEHVSHGFQVSIGMLAITAFYEQVLKTPLEQLDVEACCSAWPELEMLEAYAKEQFADTDFPEIGVQETKAKYVSKEQLAVQLRQLKEYWPEIQKRLSVQLMSYKEVKQRLMAVGAPVEPEDIGISRTRLRETFIRAQFVRRRFTVLDLAVRTCNMTRWLDGLFGKGKIWEIND